jgi:LysM repeat protein
MKRVRIHAAAMIAWMLLAMAFSPLALAQVADPIGTRGDLSNQLFSGGMTRAQESAAVKQLTALARKTIFSPTVCEGDPIAFYYTVRSGDTLAGISRRLGLNLPTDVMEQINGDCDTLAPGRTLKLLRGPFHAIISKSKFSLYVYLETPDGQKIFVRRAKVAVGKDDRTPPGLFRVSGKAKHVTWTPPPSMAKKYKKPVPWGHKGYPLGKDGYFMSLRGIEPSTSGVRGYGIHGTNAQWSIGKAASHGCIRVGDADIGPVWTLMTEGASTVQIVP